MNTINQLKQDHRLLQLKLNLLEAVLSMGPETWFVMREVSFELSQQLDEHIQRESACIGLYQAAGGAWLTPGMRSHHDTQRYVTALARFFVEQPDSLFHRVRPAISHVADRLRREMELQEAQLFPAVEDAAVLHELRKRRAGVTVSGPQTTEGR